MNRFVKYLAGFLGQDPYTEYSVEGFTYKIRPSLYGKDGEAAYKLHEINEMCVAIISEARAILDASANGNLHVSDKDIDLDRLSRMYQNMVARYKPDAIYESGGENGPGIETSYVVNQGEEFHLCVRVNGDPERKDVLVAVAAHELTHIASMTTEHDQTFWDDYALMQKIVSSMGFVHANEVSTVGGLHCNRIKISYDELKDISGYIHRDRAGNDTGFDYTNPIYDESEDWKSFPWDTASSAEDVESIDWNFTEFNKYRPLGFNREIKHDSCPKRIESSRGPPLVEVQGIQYGGDMEPSVRLEEYSRYSN